MHSATGADRDEKTDGMWSFKYEGGEFFGHAVHATDEFDDHRAYLFRFHFFPPRSFFTVRARSGRPIPR